MNFFFKPGTSAIFWKRTENLHYTWSYKQIISYKYFAVSCWAIRLHLIASIHCQLQSIFTQSFCSSTNILYVLVVSRYLRHRQTTTQRTFAIATSGVKASLVLPPRWQLPQWWRERGGLLHTQPPPQQAKQKRKPTNKASTKSFLSEAESRKGKKEFGSVLFKELKRALHTRVIYRLTANK